MPEWMIAPPIAATDTDGVLTVTAAKGSDFWRKTHYDFIHDNGHLYAEPLTGDFVAQVTFTGNYRNEYDHAGLMVWVDETSWMKTGVEFTEGGYFASAVVTRDYSDWAVAPLVEFGGTFTVRLTRKGSSFLVHYQQKAESPWTLLRIAYLTDEPTIQVGRMVGAPSGDDFAVTFRDFSITQEPR